jgi:hypothetical protein
VHFPPCPATTGRPPRPIDPTILALSFWQTIPLPIPRPAIPPGYAITGKPAYLVTHGTVVPNPYSRPTPFGELTITPSGSYIVDWGDGTTPTWTGPYAGEGEPWPNGNIAHTFDNAGTVTITVEELWTATWRFGPFTGRLTTLHTTATINDYPIRQAQAVITN